MSSSSVYAVCWWLPLLVSAMVNGHGDSDGPGALRAMENGILDLVESFIRYYLLPDVDAAAVDVNLMLGASILKGQLKSRAGNNFGANNGDGFDRTGQLTRMIDALYSKFYENNLTDVETTKKLLDSDLWTSPERESHVTPRATWSPPSGGFDAGFIVDGDRSSVRDVSDKCIGQAISTARITAECAGPEFADGVSGYALTHQVLYIHILGRTAGRDRRAFRDAAAKMIRHKCSRIYGEAAYIAADQGALDKYRDLFLEQICGMENMVEFVKPAWLPIVCSADYFDCFQYGNDSYCRGDSHLTGVSLAALGVYRKFLRYYIAEHTQFTQERDVDFQNTIIQ